MADNKLSWTELRRALANRAGVTEKEANLFLNAFNAQLVEALKSDKQVKINGLGIFRLQTVAARKSVNVASGEEITIGEYNKIAFVPESGVKELVEKGLQPSANDQKAETVDPIQKLGAQAEEIVDILGELGQNPEPKEKKARGRKPAAKKAAIEPEPAPVVEAPVVEEPAAVSEPEPAPVVEAPVAEEPKAEPVTEAPKAEPVAEAPKKQYHFVRDTLICVVILLMLLLVGYFFLRNQISGWIESLMQNPQTEMVAEPVAEEPEIVVLDEPEEWTYEELLLTESIPEGSRLAWISKKYYGDKAYWPYLYEANKDHISNPSLITVGTPIRVPKLSAAEKDTTSAQFQQIRERAYEAVRTAN